MIHLKVGDRFTCSRVFNMADVQKFAELTGDFNPVHFDEEYAKKTFFKRPIVHGPLVITLITTIFANDLPGPGTVYLGHDVKYIRPVFHGDKITGIVEVMEINEKEHIFVKTTCINQEGDVVLDGIARLKKF